MVISLDIQDSEGYWLSIGDNDLKGYELRAARKPYHYLRRSMVGADLDQVLTTDGWETDPQNPTIYFDSFEDARQHALTLSVTPKSILEQALEVAEGW